jgi:excisionase family DNA binding protein
MVEMTNEKNPFEGWTTIEEAAEIIGRSKVTVRRWVDRGFIPAYPIGRKVRAVNLEQVRAYAAEHKPHPLEK